MGFANLQPITNQRYSRVPLRAKKQGRRAKQFRSCAGSNARVHFFFQPDFAFSSSFYFKLACTLSKSRW